MWIADTDINMHVDKHNAYYMFHLNTHTHTHTHVCMRSTPIASSSQDTEMTGLLRMDNMRDSLHQACGALEFGLTSACFAMRIHLRLKARAFLL